MKVRMLVTKQGAPDRLHVETFKAGTVADLPEDLARPWLAAGVCELDKMAPGPSETKAPEAPAGKPGKKGR